jgi:hypothetical protein
MSYLGAAVSDPQLAMTNRVAQFGDFAYPLQVGQLWRYSGSYYSFNSGRKAFTSCLWRFPRRFRLDGG